MNRIPSAAAITMTSSVPPTITVEDVTHSVLDSDANLEVHHDEKYVNTTTTVEDGKFSSRPTNTTTTRLETTKTDHSMTHTMSTAHTSTIMTSSSSSSISSSSLFQRGVVVVGHLPHRDPNMVSSQPPPPATALETESNHPEEPPPPPAAETAAEAAAPTLQLEEDDLIHWVRAKEMETIRQSCPNRSPHHNDHVPTQSSTTITSTKQFLIVTGPMGCGKRKLIQQAFRRPAPPHNDDDEDDHRFVCYGSFDNPMTILQHHSHDSNPYCAYQRVILDFLQQVLPQSPLPQEIRPPSGEHTDHDPTTGTTTIVESLRRAIQNTCSDDEIQLLLQWVPALARFIRNLESSATRTTRHPHDTKNPMSTTTSAHPKRDTHPHIIHTTTTTISSSTNRSTPPHHQYSNNNDNNHNTHRNLHRNDMTQQQRLSQAFVQFLRAISSISSSIVLVFENIQFADPAAVDVLCYLLHRLHSIPNVYVIGTYVGNGFDKTDDINNNGSDDEHKNGSSRSIQQNLRYFSTTPITTTNYLVDRIRDVEQNSHGAVSIQTISIRNLNDEQVAYVLHQILQQSSSLIDLQMDDSDELCSVVVEETHGNTFLITEFLHWLYNNELLRLTGPSHCQSLSFAYWTWKIDDIYRSIATATAGVCSHNTNNAIFETKFYIASKLEKLPTLMLDALKVGACLGSAHVEVTLIECVLGCPIETTMRNMVESGTFEPMGNDGKRYVFVHDEIQNAAYNLIPETDRELYHLEIGRRLWRRLPGLEIDHYMFVILSQLHIGRRLINRSTERYNIATLCLHAGHKAAKSSTFRVALVYLKFGIELLGQTGWRDEYDLSLLIYNAASEMEMCNANYEGMKSLVESVVRNSRRDDDTIPAKTTLLHGLLVNDQQQQGLDLGRELLSNLGYGLSRRFNTLNFWLEMMLIQRLLKGKSNDYLKRLPVITDEKVLASMHILNLVRPITNGDNCDSC